jgi:hypothetical protein
MIGARIQEEAFGTLDRATLKLPDRLVDRHLAVVFCAGVSNAPAALAGGRSRKPRIGL